MQAEGLCKEGTQGDGSAAAWQIDRADGKEKRVGSTRKSLRNQKKKRQRTLVICKEVMYNQAGFPVFGLLESGNREAEICVFRRCSSAGVLK